MQYIKIYTNSQLILLRSLVTVMKKKYRLPMEILEQVHRLLKDGKLGEQGFIAIILNPVEDDMVGIKDILNLYPCKLKVKGDLEDIEIEGQKSWLTKGREWYIDTLEIRKDSSYIYVIYSMTVKRLYGSDMK